MKKLRIKTKISLENIIRSVESALAWSEKTDETQKARERSIGHRYNNTMESNVSDLGLDDYAKFLNGLKQSLIQYGKENNNAEILSRANEFLLQNSNADAQLNTILLYLKSEKF
jgi:hypothetical protein